MFKTVCGILNSFYKKASISEKCPQKWFENVQFPQKLYSSLDLIELLYRLPSWRGFIETCLEY
jgi:hypothetical protein